MKRLTDAQADVLADVLRSFHLHSSLYCRAVMGAPWGLSISRRRTATFHVVTRGACWLVVEGMDAPVPLAEGDLVILPHGHAHALADEPTTPTIPLEDLEAQVADADDDAVTGGGPGDTMTLVCGAYQFEEYAAHPLIAILPAWIHLPNRNGRPVPLLRAVVRLVQAEASQNRLAADMVITRLSEILFIEAVRAHLNAASDGDIGWLGALKDAQIGPAIAAIHRAPERPWTVETLARHVGLSRSAFSARFRLLVGEPPMQYVTRVRLFKAAMLLREHAVPLLEAARAVGYGSEVAFSKAFKRYFRITPGAYRQGKST
jgi:AraC family transcriptional regulator, alkane utilization regulator